MGIAFAPDELWTWLIAVCFWMYVFLRTAILYPLVKILFNPVNFLPWSLFFERELSLNNEPVSTIPALSHYRTFIETLLNFGQNAKDQVFDSGWWLDSAGEHGSPLAILLLPAFHAILNQDMFKRRLKAREGANRQIYCKLFTNFIHQPLPFSPKIDMKLTLIEAPDGFVFMLASNHKFKAMILNTQQKLGNWSWTPNVCWLMKLCSKKTHFDTVHSQSNLNEMINPQGSNCQSQDDTLRGTVPKKIILDLWIPELLQDILNSTHTNLNVRAFHKSWLTLTSEPISSKPLEFLLATGNYGDGYLSVLETTGILFENESPPFPSADWLLGHSLLGFNLIPDASDASSVNVIKKGVHGISCRFAILTRATYSIIIYYNQNAINETDALWNMWAAV